MRILNIGKTFALASFLTIASLQSVSGNLFQQKQKSDIFVRSIPPKGTNEKQILAKAPNPAVKVKNENKTAKFVIDISQNVLYKYNNNGNAEMAYLIASGRPSMKTQKGVRVVSHVERFPYRGAPRRSKRRRQPRAFGPFVIVVNKLDTKTGEQSSTGQFIHGTNVPSSIGKYASHGCMRMDNEVIKVLAKEVKPGDIVLIK